MLSPLDLCITFKIKIDIYVKVPRFLFFLLGAYLKEKEKERTQIVLTLLAWVRKGCCLVFCTTQWMQRHRIPRPPGEQKRKGFLVGIWWLEGKGLQPTRSIAQMLLKVVFNASSHLFDFCCGSDCM